MFLLLQDEFHESITTLWKMNVCVLSTCWQSHWPVVFKIFVLIYSCKYGTPKIEKIWLLKSPSTYFYIINLAIASVMYSVSTAEVFLAHSASFPCGCLWEKLHLASSFSIAYTPNLVMYGEEVSDRSSPTPTWLWIAVKNEFFVEVNYN